MQFRALSPEDDRSGFTCGNADLDRFFRQFAGQNQFKLYIGTTYIATNDETILGFATVSVGEIEVEALPAGLRKRLPGYPVPIVRLARLGVAQAHHGGGIGKFLLRGVLEIALRQADTVGCFGVLVDAKPEAVAWYVKFGFQRLEVIEGQSAARPRQTELFLSIKEIKAAFPTPQA